MNEWINFQELLGLNQESADRMAGQLNEQQEGLNTSAAGASNEWQQQAAGDGYQSEPMTYGAYAAAKRTQAAAAANAERNASLEGRQANLGPGADALDAAVAGAGAGFSPDARPPGYLEAAKANIAKRREAFAGQRQAQQERNDVYARDAAKRQARYQQQDAEYAKGAAQRRANDINDPYNNYGLNDDANRARSQQMANRKDETTAANNGTPYWG